MVLAPAAVSMLCGGTLVVALFTATITADVLGYTDSIVPSVAMLSTATVFGLLIAGVDGAIFAAGYLSAIIIGCVILKAVMDMLAWRLGVCE